MTDFVTPVERDGTGPQVLDITAEQYHADPCEQPSLSASIVHTLCTSTPRHAWTQHPRLNPNFERVEEEKFDIGTVAHAMLLQGDDIAAPLEFDNWRTNDSKAAAAEARAAGRVPLLAKDYDRVVAMVDAARAQLELVDCDPPLLAAGKPEQALVWEDRGVACRALVDWLRDDRAAIDDLKTTSRGANPEQWTRSTLFSIGADVQVAFYLRGLELLTGRSYDGWSWRYIVVETQPPYALSVISLGEDVLFIGRKKVEYALKLWRRCLERDEWPAYPARVCWAQLPPWEEQRWLEREMREESAA